MNAAANPTPITVRYAVFRRRDDRFVVPSLRVVSTDPPTASNNRLAYDALYFALASGCPRDDEDITVAVIDGRVQLPHFLAELSGRCFVGGHTTVWVISGPEFDRTMLEGQHGQ